MGYDLIYDRQFIKAERKDKAPVFAPVVLCGCSNLYDVRGTKERRSRSWYNMVFLTNGKPMATEAEMLEKVNSVRQGYIDRAADSEDEYSDSNFGYWAALSIGGRSTYNTTFGQYKGLVTTGCKKALTVEQLKEYGRSVNVKYPSGQYVEEIAEVYEANGLDKFGKYAIVTTTKELLNTIAQFKAELEAIGLEYEPVVEVNLREDDPKWIRRKYFAKPKKEKVKKEIDGFYYLKLSGKFSDGQSAKGMYLSALGRRSLKFGYGSPYAATSKGAYITETKAKARLKKIQDRISSGWPDLKVEVAFAEGKQTVFV